MQEKAVYLKLKKKFEIMKITLILPEYNIFKRNNA